MMSQFGSWPVPLDAPFCFSGRAHPNIRDNYLPTDRMGIFLPSDVSVHCTLTFLVFASLIESIDSSTAKNTDLRLIM